MPESAHGITMSMSDDMVKSWHGQRNRWAAQYCLGGRHRCGEYMVQGKVSDSHRTRRTRPTKSMNRADRVVESVGCDQWFQIPVTWISHPPLCGPKGAAVRLGMAGVTGNAAARP